MSTSLCLAVPSMSSAFSDMLPRKYRRETCAPVSVNYLLEMALSRLAEQAQRRLGNCLLQASKDYNRHLTLICRHLAPLEVRSGRQSPSQHNNAKWKHHWFHLFADRGPDLALGRRARVSRPSPRDERILQQWRIWYLGNLVNIRLQGID